MKETSWSKAQVFASVIVVCLAVILCVWDGEGGDEEFEETEEDAFVKLKSRSTSVYCEGSSLATRRCTIFNLCFDPQRKSFVFLVSNESVFHGMPPLSTTSTMLGLLDLSSMPNHNAFWLEYSPVLLHEVASKGLDLTFEEDPVFLMTAFLPGNLAHALRDDLLPLYFTYEDLCGGDIEACVDRFRLVVMPTHEDKFRGSAHRALYDIFSSTNRPPWNLDLNAHAAQGGYLCFSEARVGLRKDIRYYDIGATELDYEQPLANTSLAPDDVDRFGKFIIKGLCQLQSSNNHPSSWMAPFGSSCTPQLTCAEPTKPAPIVIIHRETSRRMLNMEELAGFVRTQYAAEIDGSARVRVVGLESEPLLDVICAITHAKLVIGMHGAALELAHFLQPGSGLLEIFPYALDPENYTPYKTICQRLRTNVFYVSWANPISENSLENPSGNHDGSIDHLPPDERDNIKNMTSVPRLDCCNDKRFRYWLNKDTIVDLTSFSSALSEALGYVKHPYTVKSALFSAPEVVGEPRNVTVNFDSPGNNFVIAWAPPWNLREKEKASYLVKVLHRNSSIVRIFTSDGASVVVPCDLIQGSSNSYLFSIEVVRSGRHQRTRRAYVTVVV